MAMNGLGAWRVAAAALVVIALPFMVEQVRVANYPVLEHPWSRLKPRCLMR